MLSAEDRETFARDGVLRVPGAMAPTTDLADAVWTHLAGRGIVRDDPRTWPTGTVNHLDEIRSDGALDRGGAAVLDAVLGAGRWKLPKRGGQLVVTFPEPGVWTLPTRAWHTRRPVHRAARARLRCARVRVPRAEPEARMERFSEETEIDGLPARVVELTGEPGDVVVTHPLMVHCVAPNRGDGPRVMRIRRPRVMVI